MSQGNDPANVIRTMPANAAIMVADEPGQPICIAITVDGVYARFPLSPVQATDLSESLIKALRKRLPGGW